MRRYLVHACLLFLLSLTTLFACNGAPSAGGDRRIANNEPKVLGSDDTVVGLSQFESTHRVLKLNTAATQGRCFANYKLYVYLCSADEFHMATKIILPGVDRALAELSDDWSGQVECYDIRLLVPQDVIDSVNTQMGGVLVIQSQNLSDENLRIEKVRIEAEEVTCGSGSSVDPDGGVTPPDSGVSAVDSGQTDQGGTTPTPDGGVADATVDATAPPSFSGQSCVAANEMPNGTCAGYCASIGRTCSDSCKTNRDYPGWGTEAWFSGTQCVSYATSAGQHKCSEDLRRWSNPNLHKYRCCCI